jgi:hypothetical protein
VLGSSIMSIEAMSPAARLTYDLADLSLRGTAPPQQASSLVATFPQHSLLWVLPFQEDEGRGARPRAPPGHPCEAIISAWSSGSASTCSWRKRRAARTVLISRSSPTRVSFFIGVRQPLSLSFQAIGGCGGNKAVAPEQYHFTKARNLLNAS